MKFFLDKKEATDYILVSLVLKGGEGGHQKVEILNLG